MRKIHVVTVGSSHNVKGGITSVIDQYKSYPWPEYIQMHYVVTFDGGNAVHKVRCFCRGFFTILGLILQGRADIFHIHMSHNGSFYRKYYVTKLAALFKRKTIIHLHSSEFKDFYNRSHPLTKKMICDLLASADRIITLGNEWDARVHEISPSAKTVIVHNSVRENSCKVEYRSNPFVFLYMGVLVKRKGVEDLIHAIDKLGPDRSGFLFRIAGTGSEEMYLRELTNELGLQENVRFEGWVEKDRKEALFAESQSLILPSYNEGLPICILEALSYGMPVIATEVGSVADAIIPDTNGELVKAGDIEGLSDAIKQLGSNRLLWEKYSNNAKKIAAEEYSERLMFNKVLKLYQDCINYPE